MSLPKFLWYLIKEDGRSAKVENDVVTYTGVQTPLPQTPIGWQELLIAYERSTEDHGLNSNYTVPVGLVRDALLISRDAMYKETIEVKLLLLIQRLTLNLTLTTFEWFYKFFYRGELDFSKAKDGRDVLNIPVLQSGLLKMYNANVKTVYSFAMNDVRAVNVLMDGMNLKETAKYFAVDGLDISYTLYGTNFFLPLSFINKEGSSIGMEFSNEEVQNVTSLSYSDKLLQPNWFARASENNIANITINIKGTLKITVIATDASVSMRMRFLRSNLPIGNQNDYQIYDGLTGWTQGNTFNVSVDINIPLQPGERAYFEGIYFGLGTPLNSNFEFEPGSELAVSFTNKYKATYVKAFKRFDLFRMLVAKITGSEDYAISALCQEFNDVVITCGDAIRGIEGATLKTSLEDLFKDCDATFMAGRAVTDTSIEIEERQKYYSEAVITNLGKCRDFEKQPAVEYMFNTFKFGHKEQSIEDVNGKYDPNGSNQFTGPLTKIVKEYGMVSPYKSGPYEIELLRINFEGKTTTDDSSDNDVYVLATIGASNLSASVSFIAALNAMAIGDASKFIKGQKIRITGSVNNDGVYDVFDTAFILVGSLVIFNQTVIDESTVSVTIEWLGGAVHTLNRPAFSTLEITPDYTEATIFNLIYLTPKAMFNRHRRWLRSMNAGLDSKKIVFTSGKENKNTQLKTVLSGVTVDEDKDELISDFGDYMFLPWEFIFKTEVPIDLPELLELNPNRAFKFEDEEGEEWTGILKIAGIAANEYTPQEFRLLAAPSNDIQKLIRA